MTYDDKLSLVVKAITEARKATRKDRLTILYLNKTSGLDLLDINEIRNILLQLQDANALKLNPKSNRLLPLHEQPIVPDYFSMDILDGFDDWYLDYLMKQKSKPENLDWINLLKIVDVCSDIDQQLQILGKTTIAIQSFPYPYIGRYLELFPFDNIGTRKKYQQYRWDGVQFLVKIGAVLEAKHDNNDMLDYGNFMLRIDPVKFNEFYEAIKVELENRRNNPKNENNMETQSVNKDGDSEETALWSEEFRWENDKFILGNYGNISFSSNDRLHIFKALTDKKGNWATIKEMAGGKNASFVRSSIKQIEDRFPESFKNHITIVSTQNDNFGNKPKEGAYRIKIQF